MHVDVCLCEYNRRISLYSVNVDTGAANLEMSVISLGGYTCIASLLYTSVQLQFIQQGPGAMSN